MKRIALCLMLLLASPLGLLAGDTPDERASLQGISAVTVIVENLPTGAAQIGLAEQAIQTDVELKLRLAGIRVLTTDELLRQNIPGHPALYVALAFTSDGSAVALVTDFTQTVHLDRNGTQIFGATTWNVEGVISNPNATFVRERIRDQIDQFLNAWLSVNPKK